MNCKFAATPSALKVNLQILYIGTSKSTVDFGAVGSRPKQIRCREENSRFGWIEIKYHAVSNFGDVRV